MAAQKIIKSPQEYYQELKYKKEQVEKNILNSVKKFEANTGASVETLRLANRYNRYTGGSVPTVEIELDI